MPPQSGPSGPLVAVSKEKKTSLSTGHLGSPTPTLRRVGKPLGEYNRTRIYSPTPDTREKEKKIREKKTPRPKKATSTGVDLTRRFADSNHSPCSLATNRTLDIQSPGRSSPLDRMREGYSTARDRKVAAGKSRLRGVDDTIIKKAITFSSSFGKDSIRKERVLKHKEIEVHKVNLKEKEEDVSSFGIRFAVPKGVAGHGLVKDVDHISSDHGIVSTQPEGHSKLILFDPPTSTGSAKRDLIAARNANLSRRETLATGYEEQHDEVALPGAQAMLDETTCVRDASYHLTVDDSTQSPRPSKSIGFRNWGVGLGSGQGSGASLREDALAEGCSYMSNAFNADELDDAPLMLSPQLSKSPELKDVAWRWEAEAAVPPQDDVLEKEWFHCRDFTSYVYGNTTPSAEPSKSPELKRRTYASVSLLEASNAVERQEDIPIEGTPSPQPTNSPEFLKRGSVPPTSGGCFGAGPLMGPEGMRSVKDRRKCKPRGILTIEGEFLSSSSSAEFREEVEFKETISFPAMASVEWMVAEGCEVEPLEPPRSSESSRELLASLQISPGSLSQMTGLFGRESFPRVVEEDAMDPIFWKNGLLDEWRRSQVIENPVPSVHDLSMPDWMRRGQTGLREENLAVSGENVEVPSTDFTPPARIHDFGSMINTPPNLIASNFAGDSMLQWTPEDNVQLCSPIVDHAIYGSMELVKGALPVDSALQQLSLDGPEPSSSMNFSMEASIDSCQHWQSVQSTGWSGESWREFMGRSRIASFDHQFPSPPGKEDHSPHMVSYADEGNEVDRVKGSSPSTFSVGYSEGGSTVVCTPGSTESVEAHSCPHMCNCESPGDDAWTHKCGTNKFSKGVELVKKLRTGIPLVGDESPDPMETCISVSGPPSLDSSSEEFEAHRYSYVTRGGHLAKYSQRSVIGEEEEEILPRGRIQLDQADYSPSSLLKAAALCRLGMPDNKI